MIPGLIGLMVVGSTQANPPAPLDYERLTNLKVFVNDRIAPRIPLYKSNSSLVGDAVQLVPALTNGKGSLKPDAVGYSGYWEGKLWFKLVNGLKPDVDGTVTATIYEPPGSNNEIRGRIIDVPRLEKSLSRHLVDLQSFAGFLGSTIDYARGELWIYTPQYWLNELGAPDRFAQDWRNRLGMVTSLAVTPPASQVILSITPTHRCFAQMFSLTGGLPEPILGSAPFTSEDQMLTQGGGTLPSMWMRRAGETIRVWRQLNRLTGKAYGRYASVLSMDKWDHDDLMTKIKQGNIEPGSISVVGIIQPLQANGLEFEIVNAKKGDTFEEIAKKAKMDVGLLKAMNALNGSKFESSTPVCVLAANSFPTPATTAEFVPVSLVGVKRGETIDSLCQRWGISNQLFLAANEQYQDGSEVEPGDVVLRVSPMPPRPSDLPKLPIEVPKQKLGRYVLKQTQSFFINPELEGQKVPGYQSLPAGTEVECTQRLEDGVAKVRLVKNNSVFGFLEATALAEKGSIVNQPIMDFGPWENSYQGSHPVVQLAARLVGIPYVWGGNNLGLGIDCSHFVNRVLRGAGYPAPIPPVLNQETKGAVVQYKVNRAQPGVINRGDRYVPVPVTAVTDLRSLRPGDRIIIQRYPSKTGSRHTGIYLGRINYRGRTYYNAVAHATRPVSRIQELTDRGLWGNYRYSCRDVSQPSQRREIE